MGFNRSFQCLRDFFIRAWNYLLYCLRLRYDIEEVMHTKVVGLQMTTANLIKAKNEAEKVLENNYITEPNVNMHDLVQNYGLSVIERDFGEKYNNIAGFINVNKYLIVLNRNDSKTRQSFTIAHELGHWLLHQDSLKKNPDKYAILYRTPLGHHNDDPIEVEANCFAANLLVPKILLDKYAELNNKEVARVFGVSEELVGYRRYNIATGGV